MCRWCTKHGAGKKWYMNSKNYHADQISTEDGMRSYLEEQWMNMENLFIRKIKGFSSVGLAHRNTLFATLTIILGQLNNIFCLIE
ncbi:unnamed protein product [marine sediment metagenome]|uniref:Uncharacterized protein n=1 Tax=marine sediment metagenome TaxID=412755 RepID=X1A2Y5_9ZZZZ